MKEKKKAPGNDIKDSKALRRKAEKKLQEGFKKNRELSADDTSVLIHELQVHQIELEMQNDELRRVQETLEDSRSRYVDLYDFAPIGYFTIDNKGRLVKINLTGAGMLGAERIHLLNKPFGLFIHKEDGNKFHLHRQQTLKSESLQSCELRLIRKDKTEFNADLRCIHVKDGTDQIQIAVIDITDRMILDKTLRKSEERLAEAQRIAHVGSWEYKFDSNNSQLSDELCRIFCLERGAVSLSLENFLNCIHPDDRERVKNSTIKSMQDGTPFDQIYRVLQPDGSNRIINSRAEVLFDEASKPDRMLGTVQDITDRKELEAEKEDLLFKLDERVKELNCLYGLSKLAEDLNKEFTSIFHGVIELIPPSWQHTEYTCIRIIIEDDEYKSTNFIETRWKLEAPINVNEEKRGVIQVFYTKEFPDNFEGPFLKEERNLINELAVRLGDIIQKQNAEEKLVFSERKYRSLTESLNEIVYSADPDTFVATYINSSVEKIFGYTPEQWLENPELFDQILHPDDRDRVFSEVHQASKSLKSIVLTYRIIRKDNNVRWVEDHISWETNNGKAVSQNGIIYEITERKKMMDLLEDANARLMTVIDGINALIYVTDLSTYELLFLNKYGRDIWGDIAGKICWQTLQNEQTGPCDFCTNKYLVDAEGKPAGIHTWEFQNTVTHRWFHIKDRAIHWIDGRIVRMEIATDITDQKMAQDTVKSTLEKLEQSNAQLEQFAYVASHDLKEPLRNISGFTGLLANRYKGKLDKDADEFIGFILDGTSRMKQLIDDLLSYSKATTEDKEMETVDCGIILNRVIANLSSDIKEADAKITFDKLPVVRGNAMLMDQLLQNLIANGIKFHGKKSPLVHVSAEKNRDEWVFSVKDNGIGIKTEYLTVIFDMFKRLHGRSQYEGTGIGLAICRKIVEIHGGRLWVESEPGAREARFILRYRDEYCANSSLSK